MALGKAARRQMEIFCGDCGGITVGIAVQRKYFPLHPAAQLLTVQATIADLELDGAEIDPALAENALRSAQATLASLRAQRRSTAAALVLAEQTYHREQALVDEGFTSRGDFETAKATFDGRQADIEALDAQIIGAEITLNTAEVNVGYTKITAPIDGTVVGIVTKQGKPSTRRKRRPPLSCLHGSTAWSSRHRSRKPMSPKSPPVKQCTSRLWAIPIIDRSAI
jgi:hypothetical protein